MRRVAEIAVGALTLGGLLQGLALYDVASTFRSSLEFANPFRVLRGISGFILMAGQLVFAFLFVQMLLKLGTPKKGPALFTKPAENSNDTVAI
jgi:cbb3-type cytochrome oxidase subunit 1